MRNVIIAALVFIGLAGTAGLALHSCTGPDTDSGVIAEEVVAPMDIDVSESVDFDTDTDLPTSDATEPTPLDITIVAPTALVTNPVVPVVVTPTTAQ
jgi:hypothetical protein